MIDFLKVKKNDIIYEAHPNGVVTLKVIEYHKKDEYLSAYLGWDDGTFGGICSFVESDNNKLFYSKAEAKGRRKNLPQEMVQGFCQGDKWIKDLFYKYQTDMPIAYSEAMKKAIKTKTGINV